jgi:hypothetical protein
MSGWNTIQRIRNIEEKIDKLGFKFSKSKHSDWSEDHGALSLVPKDHESLPIYSRDAELFVGRIYNIQVYNRALSFSEIQENYTAYASKFGKYGVDIESVVKCQKCGNEEKI